MTKYRNILLLVTAFAVVSSSMVQASRLTVINKLQDEGVKLCIRGEGSTDHTGKDCYSQFVNAGEQAEYILAKEHVRGNNTYEVIAARPNVGPSDWNLMGATCSNLVTDADYIIIIDSTLGKLTCEIKPAVNLPIN